MTWNPDIGGILEDVVHQFSDPFAFFRELVQNAIDAGTNEIEIEVEYDDDAQMTVATVRDFGCGMTREIIETQLCRLFSSDKYQDYTKIGRFGIGFVSVYGVEPDWVCVDTGRDGESWRVLFLPDRSFELRSLRGPVEGTTVRVAKRMSAQEHDTFRERAETVVSRWCAHVRVRIAFDGRDLREPFEVESSCALEYEEEGTRVVAGLTTQRAPSCRYYNRGLLLRERDSSPWPHVVFKIDSRFLEHTLTRDDLLHDAGYHRAVELLEELATIRLPAMLLDELEKVASDPPTQRRSDLLRLFALLAAAGVLTRFDRRHILPTAAGPTTPRACERHRGVLFAQAESALATALTDQGHMIVIGPAAELAPVVGQRPRNADDEFVLLDAAPLQGRLPEVAPQLTELFGRAAWLGRWRGPPAVVTEDPHGPIRRDALESAWLEADGELVLNAGDPSIAAAIELAADDADVSAAGLAIAAFPELADAATTWLVLAHD